MTDEKKRADHIKASEIEASIAGHLRLAMAYADIALQHDDIHDHAGFVMSADKFIGHARDIAGKLKELRKVKGVLD